LKKSVGTKMLSKVFFCVAASSFLLFCAGRSFDAEDADQLSPLHLRSRRSVELTEDEKQDVVDVHNRYRRSVGASDMHKLKWNDNLAELASQWVQKCEVKRGNPDPTNSYKNTFGVLGQVMNQSNAEPNISSVIDYIVKEQKKMTPVGSRCKGSSICYMADEIYGAVSTDVGCATGYCNTTVTKKGTTTVSNKWFTVCYYGPCREGVLAEPYQKGTACSKCSGAKWCEEKLCNSDCKKSDKKCKCAAECKNCGKVDPDTCTCNCTKGFNGDDCSQTCQDDLQCCSDILDGTDSVKDTVCSRKFYQEGCSLSCGICEASTEKNGTKCAVDKISYKSSS
jgi:hypothetical protein